MKDKKLNIYSAAICVYILFAVVTDTGSVPMKLMRLALVGIWGVKVLADRDVKISLYILRMIPFCLFAALSVFWSEGKDFAASMTKSLVINLMSMCALVGLIDGKKERVDLALKTMVFAPLVLEARVILVGGVFAFMHSTRWAGTISGNAVGMCAAFGACIALSYWARGVKKYGVLFLVNSLIVVLSASRKALLFVGIPIVILCICDTRIDTRRRIIRCGLLLVAGLVGLWLVMKVSFLYDLIGRRIEAVFAILTGRRSESDYSSKIRTRLMEIGIIYFKRHPLRGLGIDNFRYVLHSRSPGWPIDYYAHNNYVELLADTGIIGFALYYWNYAMITLQFIRNRKSMNNGVLVMAGLFLALLVGEMAVVSYFDKYIQAFLAVLWCYAVLLSDGEEKLFRIPFVNRILQDPLCILRKLLAMGIADRLPDKPYLKLMYFAHFGRKLDLKDPKTFSEKLQWLKLYDRRSEYTPMVDKYEAKRYVAEKIGEEHIIPTLGVWDRFDDIDFDALPDQFVLKCTHDCGGLVIVKHKADLDREAAKKKIEACLKRNYYHFGREWPYKDVKPRIIAEQYMVDESGTELKDYKFFNFDGKVKMLYVATDRATEVCFDFYDTDFQHLPFRNGHKNTAKTIEKPASFEQMKTLSEKLAEGHPHLRVDFYDVNGHIYFGELTFYHMSGFAPFEPEEWDRKLGDMLTLPRQK